MRYSLPEESKCKMQRTQSWVNHKQALAHSCARGKVQFYTNTVLEGFWTKMELGLDIMENSERILDVWSISINSVLQHQVFLHTSCKIMFSFHQLDNTKNQPAEQEATNNRFVLLASKKPPWNKQQIVTHCKRGMYVSIVVVIFKLIWG